MGIASKLSAAMVLAFAGSAAANYIVVSTTVHPMFDAIDRDFAHKTQAHISEVITTIRNHVGMETEEIASRDETLDLIQGRREFGANSSLVENLMLVGNDSVQVLIYRNRDGQTLWHSAVDMHAKFSMPDLASEIEKAIPAPAGANAQNRSNVGFLKTSVGLVVVAVSPVFERHHNQDIAGSVITGAVVDPKQINEGLAVLFDFTSATRGDSASKLNVQADAIESQLELLGFDGTPIGRALVYTPRSISKAGSAAIQSAMMIMLASAATAIGALWLFLHTSIISRLTDLKKHLSTAGDSGEIMSFPADESTDEIGGLSRSFNRMANQVNHLRNALADSCYLSGMSQWATTTLHNLRNGMSPISTAIWQLQRNFDRQWLDTLGQAVAMHAADETPVEQKQKLNSFLIGSIPRLIDTGLKTRELAARIERSHAAMVRHVANFEQYAHQDANSESVDLIAILRDSAEAAIIHQPLNFDLRLPEASPSVYANRILLRQIMFNIFAYARDEASKATHGLHSIGVAIRNGHDHSEHLTVSIRFRGRVLTDVDRKDAFEVQLQSAPPKSRGLGLHWCANALHQIGGSVQLTSQGPDRGTSIDITLPKFQNVQKDAA